jgi:hypothetical protein
MASSVRDRAARRRGELGRDGVERRLSPAIDAQRRLNAHRPSRVWISESGAGGSSPRYAHLTRSHD